jgi:hypothetical protein
MTSIQLWQSAQSNARDAVNVMAGDIKDREALNETIDKALKKLRAATAAIETLQRNSVGLPMPRSGE